MNINKMENQAEFRTQWSGYHEPDMEKNTLPSKTIPDQSMSMREIIERFAKGLSMDNARVPLYDEEDDMPDIRTLDLAEIEEYKNEYIARMADVHEKDSRAKKALADKKRLDEIEAEVKKRLPKENETSTNVP